jgi:hypothetical protein
LQQHSPKHLARLNRFADGIFVFACARAAAEWHQSLRLVVIDGDFLERETTTPILVATTLAHEATHAWLDHLGIRYDEDKRARIEAICARAELACVRQMPQPEGAIERAIATLQLDPDSWSSDNMRAAYVGALIDRGIPSLIANGLAWLARRRAI